MLDLVNDQQAIYANKTLSVITEKMPENEVMPCYYTFKGMICLFVTKFDSAYEYFEKAHSLQDNILFSFWKTVAKFYVWNSTADVEDFEELKKLLENFEKPSSSTNSNNLAWSLFNVNIKWMHLKVVLYEYQYIFQNKEYLDKAKDIALEIKNLWSDNIKLVDITQWDGVYYNHKSDLYYIAYAEIYAAQDQIEKSVEILNDCIEIYPHNVHAYIRLYRMATLTDKRLDLFSKFKKIYTYVKEMRHFPEKHCEVRYRLLTLLYTRISSIEGKIIPAVSTINKLYSEDGDKLAILIELARTVSKSGFNEYIGDAIGVLEEIEMRGWGERKRDIYYLKSQLEILRGNVVDAYKLSQETLKYLIPGQDNKRIDQINSFIDGNKDAINKALVIEEMLEEDHEMSNKVFNKAVKDIKAIDFIDKPYARMMRLKLNLMVVNDPFEHLEMVDAVFQENKDDIKLSIYYFEMTYLHKDLVTMVTLRKHILELINESKSISTFELVYALDLVYKSYIFQGKYKLCLEILDKINMLVPSLPKDYDLNRIRMLIRENPDVTSEDTQEYNISTLPVPPLDLSQIEKLNISKLVMKNSNRPVKDKSMLSDYALQKGAKTNRSNYFDDEFDKI